MHEIHSNLLWIGHSFDVRQPRPLFDAGITAVIDVAYEEPPAQIPRSVSMPDISKATGNFYEDGVSVRNLSSWRLSTCRIAD